MSELSSPAVETGTQEQSAANVPAAARAERVWPRRASRGWRHALLRRMLANGDAGHFAWSLVYLPAWIVVAKLFGLYDRDGRSLRHLTVDEAPQIVLWALIGTSGLSLFLELTPAGWPDASTAVISGLTAAVSVFLLRVLARWLWRALTPRERVAIIGTVSAADAFRRKLELFPDVHATIMAVHEPREIDEIGRDPAALATADRLCFAPATLDDQQLRTILEIARAAGLKLSLIPPCPGAFGTAVQLNHLAELPVFEYNTGDLSRSTLFLKRTLDVVVSIVALVLMAPLFALIAIAIKLDSRGSVIFSQSRAGVRGRVYRLYKFRSMVRDAEEQLPGLVSFEELVELRLKLPNDPRVTRVGRFLRRWSLDELPQLINVLRADMSLVGPRPEQLPVVERYAPEQRVRLDVRPGITGPMQVFGRGETTWEERLTLERDYVENLSLSRDLRILGLTLAAVVRGKGAF